MSTQNRTLGRTLAAAVALGLGAGATAPAFAATTPAKPVVVAVKPAQYPRLIDNPQGTNDVVRFTAVPGASWQLDGKDVQFTSGRSTADVKVTAASKATLTAVTGDTVTWQLADASPTSWTFNAPSDAPAPDVDVAAVQATWNDLPGTQRDTVTLPNVQGIVWTVTTGTTVTTYDAEKFATKKSVNVPVTTSSTVTATTAAGYSLPATTTLPTFPNTVTDTPTVAFTAARLNALVEVGENPDDATKGYGTGAATESVRVNGVPGVLWKIGSLAPRAATGLTYLPVDPDDIADGTLEVSAVAARGYTVPANYSTTLDFTDGASTPQVPVADADVVKADNGGTGTDTLVLTPKLGMVWWVGQVNTKNKIVYTAQKPTKDGTVVYKVKHPAKPPVTGSPDVTVYLKPVPNRGFMLDTAALTTSAYTFTRDDTKIPASNVVVAGTTVTVTPLAGIVSWSVKYEVTAGAKTSAKLSTINAVDIERAGATTMTVQLPAGATKVAATTKLAKNYVIG